MGALSSFGFERDISIEKAIDRQCILHGLSAVSIAAYLDVLEELAEDYLTRDEFRAKNAIGDFIRWNKYSPGEFLRNMLSEEEHDYWQRFEKMHANLKNKLLGETYSRGDLIGHVTHLLEKICEKSFSPQEISKFIQEKLNNFDRLRYRVIEFDGVLLLYFYDYQHIFYIAGDSDEYKNPIELGTVSIIVISDKYLDFLEKIVQHTNIVTVSLKNERGNFEKIWSQNAIDWTIERLSALIWKVNKENESSLGRRVIQDLVECKQELYVFKEGIKYDSYLRGDSLAISDIKNIRSKILAIALRFKGQVEEYERHHVFEGLISIERFLRLQFKALLQKVEIHGDIIFSLSEIKRNNTLYIASNKKGKKIEYAFGEENLSAMLASNLQCMNFRINNNIRIHCEALVGNGRSDIIVYQGRRTMAIIECKLAREGVSIADKVIDAVDQLYARYSENEYADGGDSIQLFLIVFSHDRNFRAVAKSVSDALSNYASRNGHSYEQMSQSENGVTFFFEEDRGEVFSKKKRIINLIVCNLEVDFHARAKDRKNLKPYRLS